MARGSALNALVCGIILLICSEPLPAQTSPISYAVSVGISEFDDPQTPKVSGADTSATDVGKALQGIGLPARNVLVRTNNRANTDAVRRALRTALKDRVSATDSVFVFIAGNGRVDSAGGQSEGYLMTYDSNAGAKKTTAFRLSELAQMVRESPAAGIYLTIDLTGDAMQPELESLAKLPKVVLAAISSGSDLRLASAAASALTSNIHPASATAGQLLDILRPAASGHQAYLEARQLATLLFSTSPTVVAVNKPVPPPEPVQPKPDDNPPVAQTAAMTMPKLNSVRSDAQQVADKVQPLLAAARSSRDAGRWTDAINNCKAALRLDGSSSEASTLLWSIYSGQAIALVRSHTWDEIKKNIEGMTPAEAADPRMPELRTQTASAINEEARGLLKEANWAEAGSAFKLAMWLKTTPEATRGANLADVHQTYDEGVGAFAKGDYATAKDKFEQVLKSKGTLRDKDLDPLFADAETKSKKAGAEVLLNVGIDQLNRGQYASARVIFGQVLGTDPSNERALNQLGRLARQGDLTLVDQAIQKGERELQAGQWNVALADFESALGKNADDVRAQNGRRQALDAIGRDRRNRELAAGAVGIPSFVALVVLAPAGRRARVYSRMGWDRRAAALFSRILKRNPTETEALVSLFGIYNRIGQRDTGLAVCSDYLRMKPDDTRVLSLVGEAHYERLELDPARQVFERILALTPANETAAERLLSIEDQSQGNPDTLRIYETALAACPESAALCQLVGRNYARNGRRSAQALSVLRRALQVDPGNTRLQIACAEAFRDQGDFAEVIGPARAVLAQEPQNRSALSLFLQASAKCGRLADCFAILDTGHFSRLGAVTVCEEIGALDPELRPRIHERYARFLAHPDSAAPESAAPESELVQALCRAHNAVDEGSRDTAVTYVNEAVALDAGQPGLAEAGKTVEARQEQARVLRRFLDTQRDREGFEQLYAAQIFRLGELLVTLGENPRAALAAFKEIVRLPEWQVRSTAVMQDLLDRLRIDELSSIFFDETGWTAKRSGDSAGAVDLTVNPPLANQSPLFALFGNCKARCFSRPVTLDDIVQLKRDLTEQPDVNSEFTFVVSPLRARQDVLALIYALLTEELSLRVIPLEAVALKQAIIEGKSEDALEQLLRLWVGQGDLYDVHSPIADAGTFFGRGQFIHALTTKIIHRENFGIFGLRKVGKTSLVFQLRENLPKNLIGYVDLQSIASRSCDEIYFRLSAALRREMRVKFPELPPASSRLGEFQAGRSYPSLASDFHAELLAIKDAMESAGQQPRVLLLLDEIELLLPGAQSRGYAGFENFFRQIRGLYQQEGFILSGVVGADPNACRAGKWGDRDNPIFQYYDEIFLSPLDRTECDQMVQGIGEVMGVSFEPDSLTRIFDESGGHPYVARQLCSRIVTRLHQRPLRVTPAYVEEGVEDYIAQRPDYFIGVFRGYITNEARQLMEVTAANDENDVTRPELLAFSAKAGLDRAQLDRALQDLELFHLLSRNKDRYHIKIGLLRRWIRKSWLGVE